MRKKLSTLGLDYKQVITPPYIGIGLHVFRPTTMSTRPSGGINARYTFGVGNLGRVIGGVRIRHGHFQATLAGRSSWHCHHLWVFNPHIQMSIALLAVIGHMAS